MSRFNPSYVLHHPVFLVTFIIAVPAWIIAFAGQCAAEAKLGRIQGEPVVKYLWYSIWVQLACIIHLFLALSSDSLAIHRWQLAIMLAIAEVFAVLGTEFIFSSVGSLIATGVGWLLLAMVDLVWIIYLTSEEDSFFYRILNSGGNGGLSSYNRRTRNDSGAAFGGEPVVPRQNGTYGYGMGPGGGGMSGGYAPAATEHHTPIKQNTRESFTSPLPSDEHLPKPKAKALYAYSASPDDPNEVSFARGEILEVIDSTGKWFQVRTPAGQQGIAPSNYLSLL